MKYNVTLLIALGIILIIVVDKVEDTISDKYFVEETKSFMEKGGRNTNKNGNDLCERVNKLEILENIESSNCQEIYSYYGIDQ